MPDAAVPMACLGSSDGDPTHLVRFDKETSAQAIPFARGGPRKLSSEKG